MPLLRTTSAPQLCAPTRPHGSGLVPTGGRGRLLLRVRVSRAHLPARQAAAMRVAGRAAARLLQQPRGDGGAVQAQPARRVLALICTDRGPFSWSERRTSDHPYYTTIMHISACHDGDVLLPRRTAWSWPRINLMTDRGPFETCRPNLPLVRFMHTMRRHRRFPTHGDPSEWRRGPDPPSLRFDARRGREASGNAGR